MSISAKTRDWALGQLQPELGPLELREEITLRGGLDAQTHLLRCDKAGLPFEFIVRQLEAVGAELAPAAAAIRLEHDVLCKLNGVSPTDPEAAAGWPAIARALAADPEGTQAGLPTILQSKVPGKPNLDPSGAAERCRELGRVLALLHSAEIEPPKSVPPYSVGYKLTPGSSQPVPWQRMLSAARLAPSVSWQLIHADFHMGNCLFEDNKLVSVVDWGTARVGPAPFDVGYCRMDLATAFGLDLADEFLQAYEEHAGRKLAAVPHWDLAGALEAYPDVGRWLPSWKQFGRDDLELELLRGRFGAFVERALSRI
ncbi:MAG TPA: aminoglycoside phosphotransferase family protein [Polyangiaceae bacterium]|jgi:aminoglycoside phosphotransferase (APT) family kinase protein|nr:aminoglycoside phosphotransferase family protein [Polyangiaceae bacterium]